MANPGVDVKYIGDEPTFQNFAMLDELDQRIAISKAFNWYSYFYGNTEAKEFILTYSKSIGRTKDELNRNQSIARLSIQSPSRMDRTNDESWA